MSSPGGRAGGQVEAVRPSFFCPSKPFSIHGTEQHSERAVARLPFFLPDVLAPSVARPLSPVPPSLPQTLTLRPEARAASYRM